MSVCDILRLLIFGLFYFNGQLSLANNLLLGNEANTVDVLKIPVTGNASLNFKSRKEIFDRRAKALQASPLLEGRYAPSAEVFGQVVDGKPWWGIYGQYVYRAGQRSIEGPAKESRFIFNPYLLVAAEPTNVGMIMKDKVTPKVLATAGFPFFWEPRDLKWWPKESRAEVTYDITEYQKRVKDNLQYMKEDSFISKFSLIAYNARDLGFQYIFPEDKTENVRNRFTQKEPIKIRQMLHCGGSCGYPGGCNNMSPLMPELDYMQLDRVPATLKILLWRNKPASVSQKPDFTYVMQFK